MAEPTTLQTCAAWVLFLVAVVIAKHLAAVYTFLSGAVVIVCLVREVPLVVSVFRQTTYEGLSLKSILPELCGNTFILTYHLATKRPLISHMEYWILIPKDILLLCLALLSRKWSQEQIVSVLGLYLCICYPLAFRIVPVTVLPIYIGLVALVTFISKLVQITTLNRTQNVGDVSTTTLAMNSFCSLVRAITTALTTEVSALLFNFAVNFLMDSTMLALIFSRPRSTKKKIK